MVPTKIKRQTDKKERQSEIVGNNNGGKHSQVHYTMLCDLFLHLDHPSTF
jgi:hypothetical protein